MSRAAEGGKLLRNFSTEKPQKRSDRRKKKVNPGESLSVGVSRLSRQEDLRRGKRTNLSNQKKKKFGKGGVNVNATTEEKTRPIYQRDAKNWRTSVRKLAL